MDDNVEELFWHGLVEDKLRLIDETFDNRVKQLWGFLCLGGQPTSKEKDKLGMRNFMKTTSMLHSLHIVKDVMVVFREAFSHDPSIHPHPSVRPIIRPWMASYRGKNPSIHN
jgi:hypothetical protein